MRNLLVLFLFSCFALSNATAQNGVIDELHILGTKKLKLSVVEKIIQAKAGYSLDSSLIKEDIRRLRRLPAIAHAYFQVENRDFDSIVVTYHIEENYTLLPIVNFYRTDRDELAFLLGFNESNFLGYNMRLSSCYKKDVYHSYGINLMAPNSLSKKLGYGISYQSNSTLEPVYLNGTEASDYRYTINALEVLGICEINFKNNIQIGVNTFNEKYDYQEGATDSSIPTDYRIDKLLYKFLYTYDNLNYHFYYLSGFKSQFNFQYVTATSKAAADFLIGYNDFFYYSRIKKKTNWANRLRIGISTNNNSPFAPFVIDNNMNVRGVGNSIDRGTAMVSYNTELRQTLYDKKNFAIQGNAFVDIASLRKPGNQLEDILKDQNMVVYPGIGLRIHHKKIYNAILRIDYGSNLFNTNHLSGFVFGLGQYF